MKSSVLLTLLFVAWKGVIWVAGERVFSPSKSHIWGPGLTADFVVPARYFFIEAVDEDGVSYNESIGEKPFTINMHKKGGQTARAWIQTLDRNDGSYIVRYKLFEPVEDLTIQVWHSASNKQVADSPFELKGFNYQEKCYCPENNLETWLENFKCPAMYEQIKRDLDIFNNIDMRKVDKEAVERFNQKGRHSLCHYVIKDNKVYRKTYGQHVGFKMFMDAILLSLTRKVKLPDMEFFVNLGDWPLEKRKITENPIPIFSWCGSDETRDIVMPTYDVTESTLETMGRVTLDLLSVQGNTGPVWSKKEGKAFWRGRDSRQERLDLVKMARKYPDLIDARLTNMFFFKHEEELGDIVKHISFFDFFKYKYQLNIDGTVAAYRLPYLLGGTSVVFKQDSNYYEHFYKDLEPYKHYIPFKRDLSDLKEQINWAIENDEKANEIAQNGQKFVQDNLMSKDIFCYHVVLFKEYAKKIISTIEVQNGMEEVPQPEERDSNCDCHKLSHQKEKDEL